MVPQLITDQSSYCVQSPGCSSVTPKLSCKACGITRGDPPTPWPGTTPSAVSSLPHLPSPSLTLILSSGKLVARVLKEMQFLPHRKHTVTITKPDLLLRVSCEYGRNVQHLNITSCGTCCRVINNDTGTGFIPFLRVDAPARRCRIRQHCVVNVTPPPTSCLTHTLRINMCTAQPLRAPRWRPIYLKFPPFEKVLCVFSMLFLQFNLLPITLFFLSSRISFPVLF